VEGTPGRRAIDRADELPVLGCNPFRVTVHGRGLQSLRQRLDRGAVAEILEALTRLSPYTLLLLLDVRHSKKCPQLRARRW
jgi:hypothetical protein